MVAGDFLVKDLATSEEAKEAFPDDIGSPSAERRAKKSSSFMMNPYLMPMTMSPYSGVDLKARSFVLRVGVPVFWYQTSLLRRWLSLFNSIWIWWNETDWP